MAEDANNNQNSIMPDKQGDYHHIGNLTMKLRVKEKFRFIKIWGWQMYKECIILSNNELSLHLNQLYVRFLIH
jgi:16S rRNA U1498 N3-methylase RsmE